MRVVWLRLAVLDLHHVCADVKPHNPVVSETTGALIEVSVTSLARFPELSRIGAAPGTRELLIPGRPYLVVYRLQDESVQVLRVMHDTQKWPPRA